MAGEAVMILYKQSVISRRSKKVMRDMMRMAAKKRELKKRKEKHRLKNTLRTEGLDGSTVVCVEGHLSS